MTIEEFAKLKVSAGMKIKHIPSGEIHDLLTVDFEESLMGIDGDCDICDSCENAVETITWFRCENCEIVK